MEHGLSPETSGCLLPGRPASPQNASPARPPGKTSMPNSPTPAGTDSPVEASLKAGPKSPRAYGQGKTKSRKSSELAKQPRVNTSKPMVYVTRPSNCRSSNWTDPNVLSTIFRLKMQSNQGHWGRGSLSTSCPPWLPVSCTIFPSAPPDPAILRKLTSNPSRRGSSHVPKEAISPIQSFTRTTFKQVALLMLCGDHNFVVGGVHFNMAPLSFFHFPTSIFFPGIAEQRGCA